MIRPFRAGLAGLALLLAGNLALAADAPSRIKPSKAEPPKVEAPKPETPKAEPVKTGQLLDKVVAIVNDGVVSQSDLDEQTAMIADRLKEQKTQLPPPDVLRK